MVTRGQDEQTCGYLRLPPRVTIVSPQASSYVRGGLWRNSGFATLATWSESFLSFANALYIYEGSRLFVQVEDVNDEKMDLGMLLPPINGVDTLSAALKDCEGTLMYAFREITLQDSPTYGYEVYNRHGELVAKGDSNGAGGLLFTDHAGASLAIARQFVTLSPSDVDARLALLPKSST
eukprot:NODE_22798_length_694_cov_2.259259.p1 GENE.NODE_22798_length_694_cov_2.259259~~NODE_22798_length_694_cov_2.259259.p1  ORF type:complete len:179 (-),score=53.40 NODE_22798_length_694_cov_2.259259:136-672(-)